MQPNSTTQAGTVTCRICGVRKSGSEFIPRGNNGAHSTKCRACDSARASAHRKDLREGRRVRGVPSGIPRYLPPRELLPEGLKRCPKCLIAKSAGDFDKHARTWDGLQCWCKACRAAHQSARYYEIHPREPGPIIPDGMKRCCRCGNTLSADQFYAISPKMALRLGGGYKDGKDYKCKACTAADSIARFEKRKTAPGPQVILAEKSCSICKEIKPRSSFPVARQRIDWMGPFCRECTDKTQEEKRAQPGYKEYLRGWMLQSRYGLTLETFDALLESQGGVCLICYVHLDSEATRTARGRKGFLGIPHVDHDHSTGKVRGILCGACNTRLGVLEKVDWVERATAYLNRFR